MKSFFKLLEKTAGPIGLITATAGAILDFLAPLGNYIYVLAAILLVLTVLSAICSKNNLMLQKVKNSTAFAPDFIKNELVELWQPDGVAFWKKGLFQVLTFLTALTFGAGVYAKVNPKGFLATKIDSVASLQTNLGLIDFKLGNISVKQDKIIEVLEKADKKIDLVKKETSDNPRKELSNMGISWTQESFYAAVESGDFVVVELFAAGGMNLAAQSWCCSHHSLLSLMISKKINNLEKVLTIFDRYGFDIRQKFITYGFTDEKASIIWIAIDNNNLDVIRYLVVKKSLDVNKVDSDNNVDLFYTAATESDVNLETLRLLASYQSNNDSKVKAKNALLFKKNELESCYKQEICKSSNCSQICGDDWKYKDKLQFLVEN
ncbi:MAG: hypothetical protein ABL903_20800 [Methylococcales bacterium]|nr:hypothetical protein [Methylotenera sp.]